MGAGDGNDPERRREAGQAGGDPSPWTSLGVYLSVEALLGGQVRGKRIAVQGVGAVGSSIVNRYRDHIDSQFRT